MSTFKRIKSSGLQSHHSAILITHLVIKHLPISGTVEHELV